MKFKMDNFLFTLCKVKMLKDFFMELFLKILYYVERKKYFPAFSDAPRFLNFAFPDFSVQYFIISLEKNEKMRLQGTIPMDKLNYFSISVYNNKGITIFEKNDTSFPLHKYDLNFQFPHLSCIVLRFYRKEKFITQNFYKYLPTIYPPREKVPRKIISKNNEYIGIFLNTIISKKNKNFIPKTIDSFFLPSKADLGSLFANIDATYLIAFPKTNIVQIKWTDNDKSKDKRFCGFMACNFKTTATDSSIEIYPKPTEQTLWICHSKNKKNLKQFGKKNTDKIICWKNSNDFPVIIYRVVDTSKTMLNSIENKTRKIRQKKLEKVMKSAYPRLKSFPT